MDLVHQEQNKKTILLVDALNTFTRSFCAYPQMNPNGEHIGGVIGTLKSIRKIINLVSPDGVVIVWEGGGSRNRRALYPDYKATRKPEKLNRFYEDIQQSEENRNYQVRELVSILKCLPVCQIYVEDCEADDAIAYLSKNKFYQENKVIVSSDKDFYQLLDERTKIYRLHKKDIVGTDDILKEYLIHPSNFALAKSMCGDASDNIAGVKGLGFKTAVKKFPMLSLPEPYILENIFSYAATRVKESHQYGKVVADADKIKINWKLINLNSSMISPAQLSKIDYRVDNYKPVIDRLEFRKKVIALGNVDFDIDTFLYSFLKLNSLSTTL